MAKEQTESGLSPELQDIQGQILRLQLAQLQEDLKKKAEREDGDRKFREQQAREREQERLAQERSQAYCMHYSSALGIGATMMVERLADGRYTASCSRCGLSGVFNSEEEVRGAFKGQYPPSDRVGFVSLTNMLAGPNA